MLIVVVVGAAAVLISIGGAVAYYRTPTRTFCPDCEANTAPYVGPALLRRVPGVSWRWCAACGWQGFGRQGPDWVPGRLISHDSGFHWGEERLPQDFGFKWRDAPRRRAEEDEAVHPSGFRFVGGGNDSPGDPRPNEADVHGSQARHPARPHPEFRFRDPD